MSIVVNKTRLPVTQWQTASGSVVSIANARRRDAKSAVVTLEPIQDLHGYANPWVGGAGANQCNPTTMEVGFYTSTGAVSISTNGERHSPEYIKVTKSKVSVGYFNYSDGETPWCAVCFYDSDKTFIGRYGGYASFYALTVPQNAVYARATMRTYDHGNEYCFCADGEVLTYSPFENICPISGNSAVHLHHAGSSQSDNPTSITVQLGQTVYGGTVNLVSGAGVVTHKYFATTWGSKTGGTSLGYYKRKTFTSADKSPYPYFTKVPKCNVALYKAAYNEDSLHFYVNASTSFNCIVFLPNDTPDDTPIQIVYELATPQTIQLSPTQIEMLMRNNTIWSDDGIVTVNYARIHQ